MKRALQFLMVLILATACASAREVVLDFSTFGSNVLFLPPNTPTVDGVTFQYDNSGMPGDTAMIGQFGVFGPTSGLLILNFSAPVTEVRAGFTVWYLIPPAPLEDPNGLFVSFYDGSTHVTDRTVPVTPAGISGDATLLYAGSPITQARMQFSSSGMFFDIDELAYGAPEPGTYLLLGAGLTGLGLWRFRKRSA